MIIKDLRVLNRLSRMYYLEFDKKFKYIINSSNINDLSINRELLKENKQISYIDGCFYPFIVEVQEWTMNSHSLFLKHL